MLTLRALLLSAIAVIFVAACEPAKPPFNAVDITGAAGYGTDFRLTDHNGKMRTMADFNGKAVAIFFGFTHCPDVCPTTLSDMKRVMEKLGPDSGRLQVLFVTVDPKRDTPELLAKYVPSFNASFLGLYGDDEATAKVARDFKIIYRIQPGKTADSYTVDHSAGTLIFDPQGMLRLFVDYGRLTPEQIAADIKRLI
jgi:protein SCO1/2